MEKFKIWERVAVSDISETNALDTLKDDEENYYYTWGINKYGNHIIEIYNDDFLTFKFIAKIPKEKTIKPITITTDSWEKTIKPITITITITTDSWEKLEISEEKAKELWFTLKNNK